MLNLCKHLLVAVVAPIRYVPVFLLVAKREFFFFFFWVEAAASESKLQKKRMEEFTGFLAAVGSVLFFGSYAVPIRLPSVMAAKIDPVIFQFYKSFACFSTSWLVLLYMPLKWTWWGLAGGGLWVMTGILAITAVRLAGIGTTQSLWSGLSIFVSYIWGAYFFKEPIKDHILALVALAIMAIGMAGVGSAGSGNNLLSVAPNLWMSALRLPDEEEQQRWESTVEENLSAHLVSGDKEENVESVLSMRDDCGNLKYDKANRFTQGVLCAVLVGLLNGSFMLPLKFANKDVVGVEYLVSFGVGAMVITILVLMVYSTVLVCSGRPCPCFQLHVAAGPALLTGLLWSIGNYCSIYATLYLGMALGWPLVQCQLLVSAFWAVFFYDEVTGHQARSVLLGSSVLVVSGAIMLSQFGTQ